MKGQRGPKANVPVIAFEYALYGMGFLIFVGVIYVIYKIISFLIEKMI